MKISILHARTVSNPVAGVIFNAKDQAEITDIATSLMALPAEVIYAIRESLARQSIHLDEIGDWTTGEMETKRLADLRTILLTFKATYEADVAKLFV